MRVSAVAVVVLFGCSSAPAPAEELFPLSHVCDGDDDCSSSYCAQEQKYCAYICMERPRLGGPCTFGCPAGATCFGNVCSLYAATGEPCAVDGTRVACAPTLSCEPETSTCQPPRTRAEGGKCFVRDDCDAPLACRKGTCTRSREGDPCTDGDVRWPEAKGCAALAFCNGGKCTASAYGTPCAATMLTCTDESHTTIGACTAMTCSVVPRAGIACSPTGTPCGNGFRCHRTQFVCVPEGMYGPHCDG